MSVKGNPCWRYIIISCHCSDSITQSILKTIDLNKISWERKRACKKKRDKDKAMKLSNI